MSNRRWVRKIRCKLQLFADAPGQIDVLQEFVMFAPEVRLATVNDVTAILLPVSDGGINRSRRDVALPVIQQHGLAGSGFEMRQRRNGAAVSADVLSVRNRCDVLVDDVC